MRTPIPIRKGARPMFTLTPHSFSRESTVVPFQPAPVRVKKAVPAQPDFPSVQTPPPSHNTKAVLADRNNLMLLGQRLRQLAAALGQHASPHTVLESLRTTVIDIHDPTQATRAVTLATFIGSQGLFMPTSHFHLLALADAVTDRATQYPSDELEGNLGGALAWPVALDADAQRRLRQITLEHPHALGDKPQVSQIEGGVLEFLRYQEPLLAHPHQDPVQMLAALLSTPQAKRMGADLRQRMQGIGGSDGDKDYLLAGIILQLDPESVAAPRRNVIAGFDLAGDQHWGKTASRVVAGLAEHLSATGKTSTALAPVAAYLLLASRAPVFLIKDIPDSVTFGSHAWLNLAVAAAAIEAQTPGKVRSMTFAQVMREADKASEADPALTHYAQATALLDWGVVNGMIERRDDSAYTLDELTTLANRFTTRQRQMLTASLALNTDLPSRKELALIALKERFGDLGEVFEAKLISTSSQARYPGNTPGTRLTGLHSLLDIAMMDLPRPGMFYASDQRINLQSLNANPHFGVTEAFDRHFGEAIEQKKAAIGTTLKHLIAQLPLEDRKNFEYGQIDFFQTSSYTLGLGFFDKTDHPKGETLLISTQRDGVTSAYEVSFAKGLIQPVPSREAQTHRSRSANRVSETKVFTPKSSQADARKARQPSSQQPPDSFSSARSQLIADACLEHLDLDNPAIKRQAMGLTTSDIHSNQAAVVEDFLLNLVPFRSAIVHFGKGKIGEGLFDLSLDVLGFVTAGIGAAGKVAKIGAAALSTASRALKTVKVIGAATLGALNPLGGLGDLAVGGARLVGGGVARTTQWINTLRGASGNYDLLKAVGNAHGPALIGSYSAAGRSVDTVAVLKNHQWYHYDPAKNQVYGLPIADFRPVGGSAQRTLGGFERYFVDLRNNIDNARMPRQLPYFNHGYRNGDLQGITGYRAGMDSRELRRLASEPGRSPEDLGVLAREIKNSDLKEAHYVSRLLVNDVHASGVQVTPVSQLHYLAHVDLTSKGECAGLSNVMAWAIDQGKEDLLMQNLYRAAANPTDPKSARFIQELRDFQDTVGEKYTFHLGKPQAKTGYQDIINDLTNSPTSKTLRIGTKDHGMIAGIKVEGGRTSWFFYEPNSGMAKFTTLQSMQEGMEKVLNSGGIAATLSPYGSKRGAREFYVSTFDVADLSAANVKKPALQAILDEAL